MKLIDIAIEKVTGAFEGDGYGNVTGNFDGMGLSAGVLQWCFGQGSLQEKILKPYIGKHGSIDRLGIFPIKGMDKCAYMSTSQGIEFAARVMNDKKGILKKTYILKSEWQVAWKKFLLLPEVIQLQKDACLMVSNHAMDLCHMWKMKEPFAYYWFFDLITQNGSLKDVQKPEYDIAEAKRLILLADKACQKEWLKIDLSLLNRNQIILFIASHRRASKSRSEYFNDVFVRKGTIALGAGIVHGKKINFEMIYNIELIDSVS